MKQTKPCPHCGGTTVCTSTTTGCCEFAVFQFLDEKYGKHEVGELERIIAAIKKHDAEHPDHGVGCVCMDEHAGALRRLLDAEGLHENRPYPCYMMEANHDEVCHVCKQMGSKVCLRPRIFLGRSKSLNNLITILSYLQR